MASLRCGRLLPPPFTQQCLSCTHLLHLKPLKNLLIINSVMAFTKPAQRASCFGSSRPHPQLSPGMNCFEIAKPLHACPRSPPALHGPCESEKKDNERDGGLDQNKNCHTRFPYPPRCVGRAAKAKQLNPVTQKTLNRYFFHMRHKNYLSMLILSSTKAPPSAKPEGVSKPLPIGSAASF